MRAILGSSALILLLAWPVDAQAPNDDPVIQNYLDKGISEDEARRRISYARQAADLETRLRTDEPVRFAGLYVDESSGFKVIVKLVGMLTGSCVATLPTPYLSP